MVGRVRKFNCVLNAHDLIRAEPEIILRITTAWISKTLIPGSRRTWLRMTGCL